VESQIGSRAARLIATTVAIVALLLICGTALAYFTEALSGHGSARVGSAQALTLDPGTPQTPLFPGTAGDVQVLVTNPNHFPVHLTALVLDTGGGHPAGLAVDGGHAGCDLTTLHVATPLTNGGDGWTIPADASDHALDLTGAVSMDADAPDGCQGATFDVYLQAAT
jgi:hypothetical protein